MFRTLKAVLAALFVTWLAGCTAWFPVQEPATGGIADTDETLRTPMRPAAAPADEKLPWYDFRNFLDPRSRDIERHLGA
jgi:hypothetical protein